MIFVSVLKLRHKTIPENPMCVWKVSFDFQFKIEIKIEKKKKDFTLKYLLLFEICAFEICEKFVYKHSQAIEYDKN